MSQEGTTQGDPLTIAVYAISTVPLIHQLSNETIKQAWFSSWGPLCSSAVVGSPCANRPRITILSKCSQDPAHCQRRIPLQANQIFQYSGVSITKKGKRHLGAAVGTDTFKTTYVQEKVAVWICKVECHTHFAATQPHAAYAAFAHGLASYSKWTFLVRTTPNTEYLFQPLEDHAIRRHFLPVFTGQNSLKQEHQRFDGIAGLFWRTGHHQPSKTGCHPTPYLP